MSRLLTVKFLVLLMFVASTAGRGETGLRPNFGLALKASTGGLGADVVCRLNDKAGLRLGFERMGINTSFNFEEEAVNYAADLNLKTGGVNLLFDWYLKNKIYLTGGLVWNMMKAEVNGQAAGPMEFGDILIPVSMIGTFNFQVEPAWKISPYLGIGFGRSLNLDKRFACAFELGGLFQGSPRIDIQSDGLLSPTANPDHRQAERLENQVSQYSVYPVLKFSVSYRLTSK